MLHPDDLSDAIRIPALIEPILAGRSDLNLGSRFLGDRWPAACPLEVRALSGGPTDKCTTNEDDGRNSPLRTAQRHASDTLGHARYVPHEGVPMGAIQPWHLILVLIIVLLVVGPAKLPEVGKGVGDAIREFRKATTESHDAPALPPAPGPASPTPVAPPAGTSAPLPPAAAMPASEPPHVEPPQ